MRDQAGFQLIALGFPFRAFFFGVLGNGLLKLLRRHGAAMIGYQPAQLAHVFGVRLACLVNAAGIRFHGRTDVLLYGVNIHALLLGPFKRVGGTASFRNVLMHGRAVPYVLRSQFLHVDLALWGIDTAVYCLHQVLEAIVCERRVQRGVMFLEAATEGFDRGHGLARELCGHVRRQASCDLLQALCALDACGQRGAVVAFSLLGITACQRFCRPGGCVLQHLLALRAGCHG